MIVVGLTEYGQQELSQILNIDLPAPDEHHHYDIDEEVGVIESSRNSTDLYAPVSGVVVAINNELLHTPELVNSDPYGAGWLFQMKPDDMGEFYGMLDIDAYEELLPEEEE